MAGLTLRLFCRTIRPCSPQQGLTMDYNARCWLSLSYFMPLLVWSHIVPYMAASFLCRSCPLLMRQNYKVIKLQVNGGTEIHHWDSVTCIAVLLRVTCNTSHCAYRVGTPCDTVAVPQALPTMQGMGMGQWTAEICTMVMPYVRRICALRACALSMVG